VALALADIDAVATDAVVKELVPENLVPSSFDARSSMVAPVDLWRSPSHEVPLAARSWLLPDEGLHLPAGLVVHQRAGYHHQKWLLKVRVTDDRGVLLPEALTTGIENIFAVAGAIKAKSLAIPGLGLASRYAVPRQVVWLTVPAVLRCLALSPSVGRFGIVLEDTAALEAYVVVLKSIFREGKWIS
jgi:hypothetical protein